MKESFSPSWVQELILSNSGYEHALVFDPFVGSGTVTTASSLAGVESLGFEVNPFLSFVARTKLSRARATELSQQSTIIRRAMYENFLRSPLNCYSTFARSSNRRGLFNEAVLNAFESGWQAIAEVKPGYKGLLRLALIGSAVDCGNFVRDGKALRYQQKLLDCNFDECSLDQAFLQRVSRMVEDLDETKVSLGKVGRIKTGDTRSFLASGDSISFDLCITSPPYLNSFDYSDIYRPELFLGKFVSTSDDLRRVRLSTIRSHVQVAWPKPSSDNFGKLFEHSLNGIIESRAELWDNRIPTMIQAYFEDLHIVLKGLLFHGKPSASVWIIVSTSAYAGVEIPVDLILSEMGERCGLLLREVRVIRHMRSSGQHWRMSKRRTTRPPLRESLIVFDLPHIK